MVSNIARASKATAACGLPIVHSTVNVQTGIDKPPIAPLRKSIQIHAISDLFSPFSVPSEMSSIRESRDSPVSRFWPGGDDIARRQ